jgi:phosphatidate cytidylyltransferase
MLVDRLAVVIFLLPMAAWVVWLGGVPFLGGILLICMAGAWEFAHFFQAIGYRPARPLLLVGVAWFVIAAQFPVLEFNGLAIALTLIASIAWHLIDYERGANTAATDFAYTITGIFYLGGLGQYFILVRQLPDGLWWTMATFNAIWFTDTLAYTFGRLFGRRKLAPRLSPKKTWEGYFGGILGSVVTCALLAPLWGISTQPSSHLNWLTGVLLGAVIGMLSPLGDLGISMLKRQTGVKDSGNVIAGHGGVLDRIDSWLVSFPLAYYFILLMHQIFGRS